MHAIHATFVLSLSPSHSLYHCEPPKPKIHTFWFENPSLTRKSLRFIQSIYFYVYFNTFTVNINMRVGVSPFSFFLYFLLPFLVRFYSSRIFCNGGWCGWLCVCVCCVYMCVCVYTPVDSTTIEHPPTALSCYPNTASLLSHGVGVRVAKLRWDVRHHTPRILAHPPIYDVTVV